MGSRESIIHYVERSSLVYWSHNTIHYYSSCSNDDDAIFEEYGMELSLGKESSGHMYFETIHYSSSNRGGRESCGHISQETSHSTSSNCGGYGIRLIFFSHY